jgi:hypothetical protein
MEILVAAGLFFFLGGIALIALCVLFLVLVYLIALIAVGVQALYRGITR